LGLSIGAKVGFLTWSTESRTAPKRQLDARVPPTPLYKRVVPGQPGGFCFWDLRRRAILDPRVTVVLSFGCCFSHSWRSCISSQLAPVHSPLILSIVDFVCSSYQAHNYSSFTVWSPLRSELVARFFLSGRLFFAQLWIRARVRKSGVFVTVNSVTVNSVYALPLCAWVCIACFSSAVRPTFGQRRFVTAASFCNLRRFCNWCRQFFVLSGSVSQRLSCILWRLLQGAYPLEHWR
jgi:hypothetical protein